MSHAAPHSLKGRARVVLKHPTDDEAFVAFTDELARRLQSLGVSIGETAMHLEALSEGSIGRRYHSLEGSSQELADLVQLFGQVIRAREGV